MSDRCDVGRDMTEKRPTGCDNGRVKSSRAAKVLRDSSRTIIVPAHHDHIFWLASNMSHADREECAAGGLGPYRALHESLGRSAISWTGMINDCRLQMRPHIRSDAELEAYDTGSNVQRESEQSEGSDCRFENRSALQSKITNQKSKTPTLRPVCMFGVRRLIFWAGLDHPGCSGPMRSQSLR